MRSLILPLILFILLILESITVGLLPTAVLELDLYYIPHWILVFSLLIVLFYDELHSYHGIINGIIFGFLFELVYTEMLGVYLLAYGVALYLAHLSKKLLHQNFAVTLLVVTIGIIVAEFIIYGLYFIVGQVDLALKDFSKQRLIPTVLVNLLFLLVIYPFTAKRLTLWQEQQQQLK
ncbi:rod shape-determining protein MreD [Bacillaceae bacterium W0354]